MEGVLSRESCPIICQWGARTFSYRSQEADGTPVFRLRGQSCVGAEGLAAALETPLTRGFLERVFVILHPSESQWVRVPWMAFARQHLMLPPHAFYPTRLLEEEGEEEAELPSVSYVYEESQASSSSSSEGEVDYPDTPSSMEEEEEEVVVLEEEEVPRASAMRIARWIAEQRRRRQGTCSICLEETALVPTPCGQSGHAVCRPCLTRYATSPGQLPVARGSARGIACPAPDCLGFYRLEQLRLPGEARQALAARLEEWWDAHHPEALCMECGHASRIPDLSVEAGFAIIECRCSRRFCAHCLRSAEGARCDWCLLPPELRAPSLGEFNTHIGREGGGLARNFQLTPERVVDALSEIIDAPALPPAIRCVQCTAQLSQHTACAELSHCACRQCSVCGAQSLPGQLLIDHFEGGHCPRYHWSAPGELHPFWRERMPRDFGPGEICVEGECFSEGSDCTEPAHAAFRETFHRVRREHLAASLLRSLPHELRRAAQRLDAVRRLVAMTRGS